MPKGEENVGCDNEDEKSDDSGDDKSLVEKQQLVFPTESTVIWRCYILPLQRTLLSPLLGRSASLVKYVGSAFAGWLVTPAEDLGRVAVSCGPFAYCSARVTYVA